MPPPRLQHSLAKEEHGPGKPGPEDIPGRDTAVEEMMGLLRAELSGLAAQCSRDLTVRRVIDAAVTADEAAAKAAEFGRPRHTKSEAVDDDD